MNTSTPQEPAGVLARITPIARGRYGKLFSGRPGQFVKMSNRVSRGARWVISTHLRRPVPNEAMKYFDRGLVSMTIPRRSEDHFRTHDDDRMADDGCPHDAPADGENPPPQRELATAPSPRSWVWTPGQAFL
jgi:hypothetical protein